jgi:hypothetical protein
VFGSIEQTFDCGNCSWGRTRQPCCLFGCLARRAAVGGKVGYRVDVIPLLLLGVNGPHLLTLIYFFPSVFWFCSSLCLLFLTPLAGFSARVAKRNKKLVDIFFLAVCPQLLNSTRVIPVLFNLQQASTVFVNPRKLPIQHVQPVSNYFLVTFLSFRLSFSNKFQLCEKEWTQGKGARS